MFAAPHWLWLLFLALPILVLRLLADRRRRRAYTTWSGKASPIALPAGQRTTRALSFTLHLAALALLIFALARPQWGETKVETRSEGRSLLLAIDVSRSMLAEDVEPSRIERAKLAAEDLINALPGERIGLIAFAGQPFLQAPLTLDHSAVLETIRQLDTSIIPRGGTNLAAAIALAEETLEKSGSASGALILLSDGDELEGEGLNRAQKMDNSGVVIVAIGIGTERGEPIPDPTGRSADGFVHDASGNVVLSKLDRSGLQKLTSLTDGLYLDLPNGPLQEKTVARALEKLERQEIVGQDRTIPIERYHWPLAFAILTFLTAHTLPLLASSSAPRTRQSLAKKAVATILLLAGLAPHAPAQNTPDQAYAEGNYTEARSGFQKLLTQPWRFFQKNALHFNEGSAAYRENDFEAASESFGNALQSDDIALQTQSHYNLGNTLYRKGQANLAAGAKEGEGNTSQVSPEAAEATLALWNDAIAHYDSTLELDPDHEDATFNRDLVQKKIEELENQEEEQQEEEEEQEEDQEEDSEEEKDDQEPDEDQEQEDQPEDGDEGDEQEDGEEQEGEEGEPQDEQEGNEEEPTNGSDEESEQESEGEGQDGEPESQDGGGDESETPPEGELEAQGGSESEPSDAEQREAQAQANQENPETGYSPTQARALLRNFADEDLKVRPDLPKPSPGEKFQDW